ncbi:hypothetical protein U2T19_004023 [Salmonella enterica]|nr:hypothetical protein [Salmonella enterica]EKS7429285.1 hypothetical protein [Enterobacter cancerogenus]HAS0922393.1 hypothetical protein [Enterobacter cloacae]ECF8133436.1 hypothetical protein [Salmonella enterica]EGI1954795.1 hypothetical protein [Salmonella enterica]
MCMLRNFQDTESSQLLFPCNISAGRRD